MKLGSEALELDAIDLQILETLQDQGRIPLVKLGEQVGLSSPSVIDRVKKLEDSGIITGYHASVDARRLGRDVTAFIGVSIAHPKAIATFEHTVALLDDVLECHHITGEHTFLLKIKTSNTSSLERLISTIRSIEGAHQTKWSWLHSQMQGGFRCDSYPLLSPAGNADHEPPTANIVWKNPAQRSLCGLRKHRYPHEQ